MTTRETTSVARLAGVLVGGVWLISALAGCHRADPASAVQEVQAALTGYNGPCDVACGCSAAYSMTRAMRAGYTGPLFRLVRDDGTMQTVGQTANHQVELSVVQSFCATGSSASSPVHCYVDTIYDQSVSNHNDLSVFTGQQSVWDEPYGGSGNWGIDCGAAGLAPHACAPPFYMSPRYNMPVLFTPFPTGLADCPSGNLSCTQGLPAGNVNKAVMAFLDNRQGSTCCGTNGLMEGLDYIVSHDHNPVAATGMMFAPLPGFGTSAPMICSGPGQYCATIDLEEAAGIGTTPYPNAGTVGADVFIEGKYAPGTGGTSGSVGNLVTVVNGTQVESGTASAMSTSLEGNHVRAGLAGDATPVQEAVFEFAIMSCTPSATDDQNLYNNVSTFYANARAAAATAVAPGGSTSLGPGDLAALNNNSNGMNGKNATRGAVGGGPPAPDMLYSRMFAGWSLRRLNASYTGPLVRLRRGDGTLAYFGSNASGTGLDPAASTWCGSPSTCSVAEWRCQASVTPGQEQTWSAAHDTSQCPTLTPSSGTGPTVTFNSLNGQPTLHFDGAHALCHSNTNGMPHYWSVATVALQTSGVNTRAAVVGMNGGATQLGFFASNASWTANGGAFANATGATVSSWHSLIGLTNGGTGPVYLDGVASAPANVGDIPGGSTLCVGEASTAGSFPFTGDVAEVTLSYDLTGPTGALGHATDGGVLVEVPPSPAAYADPNSGNVLFNNQQLAWGFLNNTSGTTQAVASPSIFVQASGEADVAVMGPNNSLTYYHAKPGIAWSQAQQVAGPQTTFSSPSIFVRSGGEIDIVAMGANNSLMYYYLLPGGSWASTQIAGPLTTYSAPSIYVRAANPAGEADVVAQGPDYTLMYYYAAPSANWSSSQIDGPLAAYSQPSIFVRDAVNGSPAGEADVAVQGPGNSLSYYYATPGAVWSPRVPVASAGTTFSAPTVVVRTGNPANEADIVAQGAGNSLDYYYSMSGTSFTPVTVQGANSTFAAPGFVVQPNGQADIIVQGPSNALTLYFATPPGGLNIQTLTGPGNPGSYAAPRIFARSANPQFERDVVTVGPNNTLLYYYDASGNGGWANTNIDGNQTAF